MVRAVGCWWDAVRLKIDFTIMSNPFGRWADQVDVGDDFGGPWPDWEPLDGGETAGPIDTRMATNEIDFEPKLVCR